MADSVENRQFTVITREGHDRRKKDMSEIENLNCFFGLVLYGSVKHQQTILEYIEKFSDLKVIFDKRSIDHLYICFEDPRKAKQKRGEKHA